MKKSFYLILIFILLIPCAIAENIGTTSVNVVRKEISIILPDVTRTGYYTGSIDSNGLPDGYGVFEAVNSFNVAWRYIGEWSQGQISGNGFMAWDDGLMYIGQFENGSFVNGSTLKAVYSAEFEVENHSPFGFLQAIIANAKQDLWDCDEWQEVTVPQGVWEVGKDIPSGTWTIKCADLGRNDYMLHYCRIKWGVGEPVNGVWDWKDEKGDVRLYNRYSKYFNDGSTTEYIITLEAGDYVYIQPETNKAIFTPCISKPDLGFK